MNTIALKGIGFGMKFPLLAGSRSFKRTRASGFVRGRFAAWLCVAFLLTGLAAVRAQTFTVVRTFPGASPPGWYARLLRDGSTLYGLSSGTYGYGSIFRMNTDGTGYSTLKSFPATHDNGSGASTNSDGATPIAGVVLGGDTLYGTTYAGGLWGMGTVFSLKTNGTDFAVLRHFSGSDGKAPYAELVLVSNVLYGTTAAGGAANRGAVFQLDTDGSDFRLLKSFTGSDGLLPLSGLTFSDGVLYGTTYGGGSRTNGTVFSIHPDGTGFATLKEFTGQDGAAPRYNLVVSGTSIYGTTEGGSNQSQSLVYQLSTDGTYFNILKTFSTPDPSSGTNSDGFFLQSGLAVSGGTLFGAMRWGGNYDSGVIFALRLDGSGYTVLRHFSAAVSNGSGRFINLDGAEPGPLMLSSDMLYGITKDGGGAGVGTLFAQNVAPRILPDGLNPGMQTNGFGFFVAGYSNQIVTVESCTGLAAAAWVPLATNTILTGVVRFVDLDCANYPRRYYRVRMQ
jgi:uncharacterized repeat protein (TIGR03803 family)